MMKQVHGATTRAQALLGRIGADKHATRMNLAEPVHPCLGALGRIKEGGELRGDGKERLRHREAHSLRVPPARVQT